MKEQHTLRSTPKDVFLQLFNIITFYLSIIGFITLYIQYINVAFPDKLNFYFTSIANSVRVASSILFIATPAYIFTSWLLARDLHKEPKKRDLKLRKWLLYFTLFLAAIIIIIDLITFIYNFLSGELTTQFFLKILVVLLVAVSVFGYYIWELKREDSKSNVPKTLAIILSVVVFVSIAIGFFVIGTPRDQRNRRFDEQRVSELQMIQSEIISYWTQKKEIPAKLENLRDSISGFTPPNDPDTQIPYEYKVLGTLSFELCAVFTTDSNDYGLASRNMMMYSSPYPYYDGFQQNWEHKAEKTCFKRDIDPEKYKPVDNTGIKPEPIMYR